ncbi:ATP11-domain-containing protein [Ascobolus immersus RN42]|uniref:ATP11-domain-containing protein n=1 Tax=Ascobolus immersus RN42 TaxID=1160509 RepID=A0A3N4I6N7_ASCIM|nr:ATP11-domain-containing protein [Ascobolus immersus RN42]
MLFNASRQLLSRSLPSFTTTSRKSALHLQIRHARILDVRIRNFHQPSASITERYRAKLEAAAKAKGVKSIDELKEVYKDKIKEVAKAAELPSLMPKDASTVEEVVAPLTKGTEGTVKVEEVPKKKRKYPPPPPGIKGLDSFIDVDKFALHPPEEIELLWRARFIQNETSLCATIPSSTYDAMIKLAKRHPMFLLPLPRTTESGESQGTELHLMQWAFPHPGISTIVFTSLLEYKLRGEYAQPHTTVLHYEDFKDDKGVVLLQGTVMKEGGVKVDEAKLLMMFMQRFYTANGDNELGKRRLELLEKFSKGDGSFEVGQLIEQAEIVG